MKPLCFIAVLIGTAVSGANATIDRSIDMSIFPAEMMQRTEGTVIGTVIDIVDRNPIENATVEILGSTLKSQTTKTGQFTIANVPKGFYQIRASANGYTPSVQNNLYVENGREHTAFFMLKKTGTKEDQSADNSQPVPVSTKSPRYPEEARKHGVEGIYYFKVKISDAGSITAAVCVNKNVFAEEGKLKDQQVIEKYPQAVNQLEKEALEAVWQWKFTPALKDGKAIESEVMLPIKYKLANENK